MKKILIALLLLLAGINSHSQSIPYTNCTNCWAPDSLGNHRVVISFSGTGKVAKVIIPRKSLTGLRFCKAGNTHNTFRGLVQDRKKDRRIRG